MLDRYIDFINQHISDNKHQKLLLAISGGVDSMVMLDLSIKANLTFAVAHVNHDMRGLESNGDEDLVKSVCAEHGIMFHSYKFNSDEKSSINFQEKARQVRYNWWQELCASQGYSHILTAHHSSDRVETFLLNLTRGSGIRGLSSIPIVNQNILRPLSNISKEEILKYADESKVAFREDSSNKQSNYKRNEIRNDWLPFLKSKVPNIENAIARSVTNLSKEKSLLDQLVKNEIDNLSSLTRTGYQSIALTDLIKKYNNISAQLLYQYLSGYGFTEDNCTRCLTAEVGSTFHSETHELLRDRESIILRKNISFSPITQKIDNYGMYQVDSSTQVLVSDDSSRGGLGVSNLEFPFTIRHRRDGDRFSPSGMHGATQKVKDFLTNAKLDKWSKQNTLVVEYNNEIAGVIPLRSAHGYNDSSSHIMYISVHYC